VKPGFCDNVFDMLKQKSVGIAAADCVIFKSSKPTTSSVFLS